MFTNKKPKEKTKRNQLDLVIQTVYTVQMYIRARVYKRFHVYTIQYCRETIQIMQTIE
jgi:hypothetical protein